MSATVLAQEYHGPEIITPQIFAELVAEENKLRLQLRKTPDNPDLLINMARVKGQAGRYKDAIWYLQKAQSISPGYEDAYVLEAAMLGRLNDKYACENKARFTEKYHKLNPTNYHAQVSSYVASIDRGYAIVETGTGYDELTNNRGHWQEHFLNIKYIGCDKNSYYAGYEGVERYSINDREFYVGTSVPFNDFSYSLEYRQASQSVLLPDSTIYGEVGMSMAKSTAIILSYRNRKYIDINNTSTGVAVDYYFSDYQLVFAREWNRAKSELQSFDKASVDKLSLIYYFSKSKHVGVSYYAGKELNYDGTTNPPFSKTRTIVLSGLQPVSKSWSLLYTLKKHHQSGYFDQQGIRVGVRYRY